MQRTPESPIAAELADTSHEISKITRAQIKAVALFSGGLDSALAVWLMAKTGIQVTALHFLSPFSPGDQSAADSPVRKCAAELGVELTFLPKGPEFVDIVRNPAHGHGKNINPCIDCRIYTLVRARELMVSIGASFLVTGEVVGQRPMSQGKNTIRMIEKLAGCDGLIVRPLSGRILRPSQAELDGLISREDLCDIAGRGRKKQLALAREAGLKNFSAPAGGCLLTDKLFTARLRDLFAEREHVTLEELRLLHLGRQFRVRPALKIIVGRNEQENTLLENGGLYRYLFSPDDFPGPLVAASAEPSPEERILIASVVRRYSKATARTSRILFTAPEQPPQLILTEEVADDKWLQERMIGSAAFTAEARR